MWGLESLVKGAKYAAGGLALGMGLLFGGGCERSDDTIDASAEIEVSNFTATSGSYENSLSWNNPDLDDPCGIMIRRNQDTFPTSPTDGTLVYEGSEESYVDTGLEADVLYCYKAFVVSYVDINSFSNGVTAWATPFDGVPTGPVSSFQTVPIEGGMQLSWVNPTDADFSRVEIWRVMTSGGQLVYSGTGQSTVHTGLNPALSYNYSATAYDANNNGSVKVYSGAKNPLPLVPPANVSNLNAVSSYSETTHKWTIDFTWINPGDSDFAGVMLRRNTGTSDVSSPTDGTLVYQGTGQSCSDIGLDDNRYTYKIFTYDDIANYSNGISTQATLDNVYAVGWIGGGSNGWKTTSGTIPLCTDYQSFNQFTGVFVKGDTIYIADSSNNRISKWNVNGTAIGWIGGGSNGWKTSTAPSTYGSDFRSFNGPYSVFVDNSGYIYVTDYGNHRVSKWDSNGNAIGWIGGGSNGWKTTNGTSGTTNYQGFYCPAGIVLDSSGNIYVVEANNNRVSQWTAGGSAVGWIGGGSDGWKANNYAPGSGSDYQSFYTPFGLALDSSGNLYIADCNNNRISKWNVNGTAAGWIGIGCTGWNTFNGNVNGVNYNYFWCPMDVAVASNGDIYVTDGPNQRVCKWNSNGTAIGWFGSGSHPNWATGTAPGSGSDYQSLNYPEGISLDGAGNVYIADRSNNRVTRWKD